jgi:hypothetical protein
MLNPFKTRFHDKPSGRESGVASDAVDVTPMQEISLDDLEALPYAGVAMPQDTWAATYFYRDASPSAWSLLHLLPKTLSL